MHITRRHWSFPNHNTDQLKFCEEVRVSIAGVWYLRKDYCARTATPGGLMTVRQKEFRHILVSRTWTVVTNRNLEFDSDHHAVIGSFKRCKEKPSSCRRYRQADVKLLDNNVQYHYTVEVQNRFKRWIPRTSSMRSTVQQPRPWDSGQKFDTSEPGMIRFSRLRRSALPHWVATRPNTDNMA